VLLGRKYFTPKAEIVIAPKAAEIAYYFFETEFPQISLHFSELNSVSLLKKPEEQNNQFLLLSFFNMLALVTHGKSLILQTRPAVSMLGVG